MKNEIRKMVSLELTEEEFRTIQKFAFFLDTDYRNQICDRDEAISNVMSDFAATESSNVIELLVQEDIVLKIND